MANKLAGYASDELIDWNTSRDTDEQIEIPDVVGWRILVQPLEAVAKTAGGIVLPDEVLEKEQLVMYEMRTLQA